MTLLEAMENQRRLHLEAAEAIATAITAVATASGYGNAPSAPAENIVAQPTEANAPSEGQLFTIDGHRDDG